MIPAAPDLRSRLAILQEAGSRPLAKSNAHGHLRQINSRIAARLTGREINNIVHIHVVCTYRERIEPVRKSVADFQKHSLQRQAQIESGHPDLIETATCSLRSIARQRRKRPFRIMRPVTYRLQTHAKPPKAT